MDYLSKEIRYQKFLNRFELYWDNDVVSLSLEDCRNLIPILEEYVK
jgi:hypothetical protein